MNTRMSMRDRRKKIAALVQDERVTNQYPRVWDTTCDDPFFAETQTGATEAGGETEEATTLPETEEMSEVPEPDTTATPIRGRVYRITAYNADQGGCHDVDPATLPDDFLDYLADTAHAAHAAHHDMPVDASQYIPVAVVKSILTKWETHYEEFRDFLAGRGLNPDGAGCAIFAIKEIRDDIDKLSTPAQTTDKEGEQ